MSIKVLILNGPNLNMLGQREPEIYGDQTLADIEKLCRDQAASLEMEIAFRQSNHEGELVTWIQDAVDQIDGLVINAAGYTHTSVALHDALKLLSCPVIEVHLSDPQEREDFRHFSYIEPIAARVIKGQGAEGYAQALKALASIAS